MTHEQFPEGISKSALIELYERYKKDPLSLPDDWRYFFKGYSVAKATPSVALTEIVKPTQIDDEFKVVGLIQSYRERGHLFTHTNPVRKRRKYLPTLDLEYYGLDESKLDTIFRAGNEVGIGDATLKDIISFLTQTYCGSVGAEFMFIRHKEKSNWLIKRMERDRNTPNYKSNEKIDFFHHLKKAVGFEKFIHNKFTGQKRFSLEGTEVLIPSLHMAINKGSDLGINEFIIGMAHRGRLNVMTNVFGKPYENVFNEFNANKFQEDIILGDVKYHLGYSSSIIASNGAEIALHLAPNPSHLETVGPVIEGLSRAKIIYQHAGDISQLCPILIHGDAAVAAQGVVYELIQMSELAGYRTGGTLHIVLNNQVGFTTNYLDARTSTYCTDIAKVVQAPVFHVNGDDVEAVAYVVSMAMEYRQTFHTDVFIDILSYRKYGHNEGDEPRFTQPTLYKTIASHPNPRDIYKKKIIQEGVLTSNDVELIEKSFDEELEEKFEKSKEIEGVKIRTFLRNEWLGLKYSCERDFEESPSTGVSIEMLDKVAFALTHLPEHLQFFSKTIKLVEDRKRNYENSVIDWAMAEQLAYGSLLSEGFSVRLSGQDSIRGTFAHRHAAHTLEDTDRKYFPLKKINDKNAHYRVYNSLLSEYGVLGFEYGYSLAVPNGLTIWEAQFGDFSNVAQVIIDQYISSAEEKWGLMSGLVLLLPHGFEGQGPEHSSARVERYLSMAANNNMQICNCSTPANFFHVLRRQLKRNFRIPLVIFTPKSLLRHPKCISLKEDLLQGRFNEIIDDKDVDIEEVRRLVFCTGKIYYDLLERKEKMEARDVALIRIEQLHPFPLKAYHEILRKYPNVLLKLWVQEEPENMGAWPYIHSVLKDQVIVQITRLPSASPATGLNKIHLAEQEEILNKVFKPCNCEKLLKYCGLQCFEGKSRVEILKQHNYIFKTE